MDLDLSHLINAEPIFTPLNSVLVSIHSYEKYLAFKIYIAIFYVFLTVNIVVQKLLKKHLIEPQRCTC